MPLQRTNTADKFIVDRRKAHRNTDVSRAVRKTRDRLSQRAGNPAFERELLKLHARAMVSSASAIPLLVLIITAVGLFAGMTSEVLVWALVTVLCYAAVGLIAHRIDSSDASRVALSGTRALFLAGHFISGIGWAYFAALGCAGCGVETFPVFK